MTAGAGRRFSARLVARSARRRTGRGPLETGRLTGTGIRKPGGYGVTNVADTTPWPTPRPSRYQPDEVHRRGKEMALVPAAIASSRLGRRRPAARAWPTARLLTLAGRLPGPVIDCAANVSQCDVPAAPLPPLVD